MSWLLLRRGECQELGSDPVEVAHVDALVLLVLLEAEVLEPAKTLLFRLPHAVDNILDVENVVSLAVSSVTEWHARWIHLRNGCESQMRRP